MLSATPASRRARRDRGRRLLVAHFVVGASGCFPAGVFVVEAGDERGEGREAGAYYADGDFGVSGGIGLISWNWEKVRVDNEGMLTRTC